jgi:hypothetical protein
MMKMTSLNFGVLKESIAKKASVELTRGYEGDTLMRFMETVKKSPTLKKQHFVYKNIEMAKPFKKENLAERFLNQNLNLIQGLKWHKITAENLKLRTDLLGAPDKSTVTAREDKRGLYESINTLIESHTNTAFTGMESEARAYGDIIAHLTRETVEEADSSDEISNHPKLGKVWEYITKNAVSNFNERFSHLNEDEQQLFRVLTAEGEQRISYVKALREETMNNLKKKLDEATQREDVTLLETFKNKLTQEISNEILVSDEYIFHVADLNQTLKKL